MRVFFTFVIGICMLVVIYNIAEIFNGTFTIRNLLELAASWLVITISGLIMNNASRK